MSKNTQSKLISRNQNNKFEYQINLDEDKYLISLDKTKDDFSIICNQISAFSSTYYYGQFNLAMTKFIDKSLQIYNSTDDIIKLFSELLKNKKVYIVKNKGLLKIVFKTNLAKQKDELVLFIEQKDININTSQFNEIFDNQKDEIQTLKEKNTLKEKEISILKEKYANLEKKIDGLLKDNNLFKNKMNDLTDMIKANSKNGDAKTKPENGRNLINGYGNSPLLSRKTIIYNITDCSKETKIFGVKDISYFSLRCHLIIDGDHKPFSNTYHFKYKGKHTIELVEDEKLTRMSHLFDGCDTIDSTDCFRNWDVSYVYDMSGMFANNTKILSLNGFRNWDTSWCWDMSSLFEGCTSLINLDGLMNWNFSRTDKMDAMFSGCTGLRSLRGLNMKNLSLSENIKMNFLFYKCPLLKDIDILKNWNVSRVISFGSMFSGCSSLRSLAPLSSWKAGKIVDNVSNMFSNCTSLQNLEGLNNFNPPCSSFEGMFSGCTGLKDISAIKNWNVITVNNFSNMFTNCNSVSTFKHLSNWKFGSGEVNFDNMFKGSSKFDLDKIVNGNEKIFFSKNYKEDE